MIPGSRRAAAIMAAGVLWLIAGCAGVEPARIDPAAEAVVNALADAEKAPPSVKGIGDLRLRSGRQSRPARMAWIAASDGRIRIEVLVPGGGALLSLAADGFEVRGRLHSTGRSFRWSEADPSLGQVIDVPVHIGHLAALLCGRVPMVNFHSAEMVSVDQGQTRRLVLKRWRRTRQAVDIDGVSGEPKRTVYYDAQGDRIYEAIFDRMTSLGRYRIPEALTLTGEKGALRLNASRCWAPATVTEETFVLPAVKSGESRDDNGPP